MTTPMVCPRDYTLRSLSGKTIAFKANEPVEVPDDLYAEALSVNILPVEGGRDTDPTANSTRVAVTGALRDALVYQAIAELSARNNPEDWDGGGQPKPEALKLVSGVQMGNAERSKYWAGYREIIGSNSEIPTHPNVEIVQELNSISTRRQLEEFARDYDLPYESLKGKSNFELKAVLLSMVINGQQAPLIMNTPDTTKPSKPKGKGASPHSGGLEED